MNELLVCSEKMEMEKETAEGVAADLLVEKDDVKRGVGETEADSPQMTLQATEVEDHVEDLGKVRTIKGKPVVTRPLHPLFSYVVTEFMRRDQLKFKVQYRSLGAQQWQDVLANIVALPRNTIDNSTSVHAKRIVELRGGIADTRTLACLDLTLT